MKSSPILLVTVEMSATRDRTTIFICSWVGVAMGWTLCLVVAVLEGVRYRLEGEYCDGGEDMGVRGLWLSGVYDQLNVQNSVLFRRGRSTCMSTCQGLRERQRTGIRIEVVSSGPSACIPGFSWCMYT